MNRRRFLASILAVPAMGCLAAGSDDDPSVDPPLADLRDRRAENKQELVVLMTPAVGESFHLPTRREQAERLAEALAIDGNAETFIEWHHDNTEYWERYAEQFVIGKIEPRSFVAATHSPAVSLPSHIPSMADAWVCMTSETKGTVRLIENDAYNDRTISRRQGSVEFA